MSKNGAERSPDNKATQRSERDRVLSEFLIKAKAEKQKQRCAYLLQHLHPSEPLAKKVFCSDEFDFDVDSLKEDEQKLVTTETTMQTSQKKNSMLSSDPHPECSVLVVHSELVPVKLKTRQEELAEIEERYPCTGKQKPIKTQKRKDRVSRAGEEILDWYEENTGGLTFGGDDDSWLSPPRHKAITPLTPEEEDCMLRKALEMSLNGGISEEDFPHLQPVTSSCDPDPTCDLFDPVISSIMWEPQSTTGTMSTHLHGDETMDAQSSNSCQHHRNSPALWEPLPGSRNMKRPSIAQESGVLREPAEKEYKAVETSKQPEKSEHGGGFAQVSRLLRHSSCGRDRKSWDTSLSSKPLDAPICGDEGIFLPSYQKQHSAPAAIQTGKEEDTNWGTGARPKQPCPKTPTPTPTKIHTRTPTPTSADIFIDEDSDGNGDESKFTALKQKYRPHDDAKVCSNVTTEAEMSQTDNHVQSPELGSKFLAPPPGLEANAWTSETSTPRPVSPILPLFAIPPVSPLPVSPIPLVTVPGFFSTGFSIPVSSTSFGGQTSNTSFGIPSSTSFGVPTPRTSFSVPTSSTRFGAPTTTTGIGNQTRSTSTKLAEYIGLSEEEKTAASIKLLNQLTSNAPPTDFSMLYLHQYYIQRLLQQLNKPQTPKPVCPPGLQLDKNMLSDDAILYLSNPSSTLNSPSPTDTSEEAGIATPIIPDSRVICPSATQRENPEISIVDSAYGDSVHTLSSSGLQTQEPAEPGKDNSGKTVVKGPTRGLIFFANDNPDPFSKNLTDNDKMEKLKDISGERDRSLDCWRWPNCRFGENCRFYHPTDDWDEAEKENYKYSVSWSCKKEKEVDWDEEFDKKSQSQKSTAVHEVTASGSKSTIFYNRNSDMFAKHHDVVQDVKVENENAWKGMKDAKNVPTGKEKSIGRSKDGNNATTKDEKVVVERRPSSGRDRGGRRGIRKKNESGGGGSENKGEQSEKRRMRADPKKIAEGSPKNRKKEGEKEPEAIKKGSGRGRGRARIVTEETEAETCVGAQRNRSRINFYEVPPRMQRMQ